VICYEENKSPHDKTSAANDFKRRVTP